jgi:hypothetical protein
MVEPIMGQAIASGGDSVVYFVDEDDSFEAGSTAVVLRLILNLP